MKFSEFFKEKIPVYAVECSVWLLMLMFLSAFHVSIQLMIIFSILTGISEIGLTLWEFFRKKIYYCELLHHTEELKQKYLVSEIMEEPEFLEGKIFYSVLKQTSRAMTEEISAYRRENAEFREFIELWVHEVKLPISSLQLMLHNHPNEITAQAQEQLRKVNDYTDTVLYYARSEIAEKDYLIKPISLKKIVGSVLRKNREDLILHEISLHVHDLEKEVNTDGKWIEYILTQLISNSLKYTDKEKEIPEISIYAEETSDTVKLVFRDNGIGISENDLPYIFEKSFTGTNGHTSAKSTGMGLYITERLCRKLGHQISCRSEVGKFTEFQILFQKNDFFSVAKK